MTRPLPHRLLALTLAAVLVAACGDDLRVAAPGEDAGPAADAAPPSADEILAPLAAQQPAVATALAQLPEVADGLDDGEARALRDVVDMLAALGAETLARVAPALADRAATPAIDDSSMAVDGDLADWPASVAMDADRAGDAAVISAYYYSVRNPLTHLLWHADLDGVIFADPVRSLQGYTYGELAAYLAAGIAREPWLDGTWAAYPDTEVRATALDPARAAAPRSPPVAAARRLESTAPGSLAPDLRSRAARWLAF